MSFGCTFPANREREYFFDLQDKSWCEEILIGVEDRQTNELFLGTVLLMARLLATYNWGEVNFHRCTG
jgi:hypothetical protein